MGKHFKQPVSDAGSDAAGSDATELLDGAADVTRRMSGAEGARQTTGRMPREPSCCPMQALGTPRTRPTLPRT